MAWCQPAGSPSWQDSGMERVLGIGGYFMRAADPAALGAWYRDCLGLDADENGLWRQGAGLTVFATFESETGYFGARAQQTMLHFRGGVLGAELELGVGEVEPVGVDHDAGRADDEQLAVHHVRLDSQDIRGDHRVGEVEGDSALSTDHRRAPPAPTSEPAAAKPPW